MLESTGFFYLYIYPIISSIFAGFIFWVIFSYYPEKRRKESFGVGVFNDLMRVNNLLFQYFEIFLRHQKNSPSLFQNRIHASSISEEEFDLFLQNKIIGAESDYYPEISAALLHVGNDVLLCRNEIDETIGRLYSFNMYLSSQQIQLLRDIQEKIFRYDLERISQEKQGEQHYRALDPSISYMRKVLVELMDNHKKLRAILFKNNKIDRTFAISKTQNLFYSGFYSQCVVECDRWIQLFPFDSDLHISYKIRALQILKRHNEAYALLDYFLEKNTEIMGYRHLYYFMIFDPTAFSIILKKISMDDVNEMKIVVERENTMEKSFLASNSSLRQFFTNKKNM